MAPPKKFTPEEAQAELDSFGKQPAQPMTFAPPSQPAAEKVKYDIPGLLDDQVASKLKGALLDEKSFAANYTPEQQAALREKYDQHVRALAERRALDKQEAVFTGNDYSGPPKPAFERQGADSAFPYGASAGDTQSYRDPGGAEGEAGWQRFSKRVTDAGLPARRVRGENLGTTEDWLMRQYLNGSTALGAAFDGASDAFWGVPGLVEDGISYAGEKAGLFYPGSTANMHESRDQMSLVRGASALAASLNPLSASSQLGPLVEPLAKSAPLRAISNPLLRRRLGAAVTGGVSAGAEAAGNEITDYGREALGKPADDMSSTDSIIFQAALGLGLGPLFQKIGDYSGNHLNELRTAPNGKGRTIVNGLDSGAAEVDVLRGKVVPREDIQGTINKPLELAPDGSTMNVDPRIQQAQEIGDAGLDFVASVREANKRSNAAKKEALFGAHPDERRSLYNLAKAVDKARQTQRHMSSHGEPLPGSNMKVLNKLYDDLTEKHIVDLAAMERVNMDDVLSYRPWEDELYDPVTRSNPGRRIYYEMTMPKKVNLREAATIAKNYSEVLNWGPSKNNPKLDVVGDVHDQALKLRDEAFGEDVKKTYAEINASQVEDDAMQEGLGVNPGIRPVGSKVPGQSGAALNALLDSSERGFVGERKGLAVLAQKNLNLKNRMEHLDQLTAVQKLRALNNRGNDAAAGVHNQGFFSRFMYDPMEGVRTYPIHRSIDQASRRPGFVPTAATRTAASFNDLAELAKQASGFASGATRSVGSAYDRMTGAPDHAQRLIQEAQRNYVPPRQEEDDSRQIEP
jgi:hypothetical protein